MKSKNSVLIILGNTVSKFGNVFYYFTLNWWIAKVTNNLRLLGYIGVASTLPLIIFNLFGGIIADRFNKKKLTLVQPPAPILGVFWYNNYYDYYYS